MKKISNHVVGLASILSDLSKSLSSLLKDGKINKAEATIYHQQLKAIADRLNGIHKDCDSRREYLNRKENLIKAMPEAPGPKQNVSRRR